MVKKVQIKIGKYLRRQIPNRQPFALAGRKQALARRQAVPVGTPPFNVAVLLRIVEHHLFHQFQNQQLIRLMIARQNKLAQIFIKQALVNAHEKRLNIHLQNITVFGVVARTFADKTGHPPDSVLGSFSVAAAVAVLNKRSFKQMVKLADNQMMNYAVAKIGGKNLTLHRFGYNKGNRAPGHVSSVIDVFPKLYQLLFKIDFKSQGVCGAALVAPAFQISGKQLVQTHVSALHAAKQIQLHIHISS